jgi:hypothetical protein
MASSPFFVMVTDVDWFLSMQSAFRGTNPSNLSSMFPYCQKAQHLLNMGLFDSYLMRIKAKLRASGETYVSRIPINDSRRTALEGIFSDYKVTELRPDELLTTTASHHEPVFARFVRVFRFDSRLAPPTISVALGLKGGAGPSKSTLAEDWSCVSLPPNPNSEYS